MGRLWNYCRKLRTRARAIIPSIIRQGNFQNPFFPNCVIDRARRTANTAIAQGRNGINANAASEVSAVKSCREQDTR